MSRYPRAARNAAIKCIPCNAPVTETADGGYVCVSCGNAPIQCRNGGSGSTAASADDGSTAASADDGSTAASADD